MNEVACLKSFKINGYVIDLIIFSAVLTTQSDT